MVSSNCRKLYATTLLSGVVSISSYILVYTHQDWVTRNFTRGGAYAILPIATAFYFAVVHGIFTSSLMHMLGFRAATKSTADQGQAEVPSQEEVQP
jgi:F0F1-type ATP synthase assembly protein I